MRRGPPPTKPARPLGETDTAPTHVETVGAPRNHGRPGLLLGEPQAHDAAQHAGEPAPQRKVSFGRVFQGRDERSLGRVGHRMWLRAARAAALPEGTIPTQYAPRLHMQ